ncbi:MAG TPA: hypothetical protein DEA22_08310 [Blastocatellia bacterium]|nr:hypothetical protein [Blastocatellia bacterium]
MSSRRKKAQIKKDTHRLFLGVDGGGTKTHIVLVNDAGEVMCEGHAGPSNPLRVGVETAASNILKAVNDAADCGGLARSDIAAAVFGLAGVRRADLRQRVRESFLHLLRVDSVKVITDAEIALYAVTEGKPGVVVIAGTGSICYGRNKNGKTAIAGGWGPLAGDEGGAAGIARDALHAVAKASDGRAAATELSKSAAEYFRASGPENLIVAIYSPQVDNLRIAGFARSVVAAALDGDKIALEIIRNGGIELGTAACAVIAQLGMQKEKVPIGCVGSIFQAGKILTGPMIDTLRESAPRAFLTVPRIPPAHAAALLALQNGGL